MFSIKPVSPDYFIPDRFRNKTILITGAASGMGAAAASRAALEGASVACVDRQEKELEKTVEKIKAGGHNVVAIVSDVSRTADADRMVAETVKVFGSLDMAINGAGIFEASDPAKPVDYSKNAHLLPAPIHEAADEYWEAILATNITGVFKSLRAELRQMIRQGKGGSIVNIGSVAAIIGIPGNPAYSTSKHGVTGITRNAAIDYAPYGIRVNSVNPAATDTPMIKRVYEVNQAAKKAGKGTAAPGAHTGSLIQQNDPEGRISTPWEQVAVMLFLLSDEASDLTGGIFPTDGGSSTR
jgi:NAD(P)-dependent dehydrogenase (short-subunit alcohol dehydrogenase family)